MLRSEMQAQRAASARSHPSVPLCALLAWCPSLGGYDALPIHECLAASNLDQHSPEAALPDETLDAIGCERQRFLRGIFTETEYLGGGQNVHGR